MELFKYVFSARIDVLQHQRIRFTQPSEFNDPWEALPNLVALFQPESIDKLTNEVFQEGNQGKYEKLLEETLKKLKYEHGISLNSKQKEITRREFRKKFIPRAEKEISYMADTVLGLKTQDLKDSFNKSTFDRINKLVGILCFSEIPDSLLMWSHYADSHKGFIIGFDSSHPFFDQRKTKDDLIRNIKPVHYAKERPSFAGFSKKPNESEIFRFADHMLLTKADVWEYEHEWRMVHILEAATECIGKLSSIFLFEFPPECISSIILGCRTDKSTKTSILNILTMQNFSHVKLFSAEQDRSDYKLNIVESK